MNSRNSFTYAYKKCEVYKIIKFKRVKLHNNLIYLLKVMVWKTKTDNLKYLFNYVLEVRLKPS